MLARRSRLVAFSAIAVVAALLALGTESSAELQDVSVTLSGPSVGWVEQELSYVADGDYDLGEEEECPPDVTVTESYEWSFGGGTCTTPPADSESESCEFEYEDGAQYHTISVTYTVRVTYPDESYEEDSASDSIDVKVQRPELTDLSAAKNSICAGAVASSVHRTTITATVENGFGEPAGGRQVSFTITAQDYVDTAASVSPSSASTNGSGEATTTLTSSDKECTVTVEASVGTHAGQSQSCDVGVGLPTGAPSADPTEIPTGYSTTLQLTLVFGQDAVAGHSIAWSIAKVWDEEGNLVYDRDGEFGSGAGYGYLDPPSSSTNSQGVSSTQYHAGAVGKIVVDATDTTCYTTEAEHPNLGEVTIIVFDVMFIADRCHDYIVPKSSLNTITYKVVPQDFSADAVQIKIKNSSGATVRTLSDLPTSSGTHEVQWDGLSDGEAPLGGGIYTYEVRAEKGSMHATDSLGNRKVIEWALVVIVEDRIIPPHVYESGTDESTIADALPVGVPTGMTTAVQVSGGTQDSIPYYSITSNTGSQGTNADVKLLASGSVGDYYKVYTTPTDSPDLPEMRYTVDVSGDGVRDVAGNEWDLDPSQGGRQIYGRWIFGIAPDGEIVDFTESYW